MIDLADLLKRNIAGLEALEAKKQADFSRFSRSGEANGKWQPIGPKDISRLSCISRSHEHSHAANGDESNQRCVENDEDVAHARVYPQVREIRETREKEATTKGCFSRSENEKREKREISGLPVARSAPLPGAATCHSQESPSPLLDLNEAKRQRDWWTGPQWSLMAPAASPACLEWRAGFALLSCSKPPCPGLPRWPATYAAARQFLDVHAERALDLGWSTLDLWGVHPIVGAVRSDCLGALLFGRRVIEVHADCIRLDRHTFRQHPCPGGRIPVWEFQKQEARNA